MKGRFRTTFDKMKQFKLCPLILEGLQFNFFFFFLTELTIVSLLLFALAPVLCSELTASQGISSLVNTTQDKKKLSVYVTYFNAILYDVADGGIFYCKIPGCAANVTDIFCNEKQLPIRAPLVDCTGPPPRNTVCQYNGRAFVFNNAHGDCDFEGKDGYIQTQKCTGIYFPLFISSHMFCIVIFLQSFIAFPNMRSTILSKGS